MASICEWLRLLFLLPRINIDNFFQMKTYLFISPLAKLIHRHLLLLTLLLSVGVWGQTSFTATYTFGTSGNVTSFNYNGNPIDGVAMGSLVKIGITSTSSNNNFRGNNWPTTTSIDTGKYIGFTMTAVSGYTFTVNSITFGIGRSGTGTRQAQWRGSADSFASPINNYTTLASGLTNTNGVLQNPDFDSSWTGNVLTLGSSYTDITSAGYRLYLYNAEAAGGTAGLQGVLTITGSYKPAGNPSTPTLTVATSPATNPVAVSGLDYILGAGPSAAKTFTVAGSGLTADVTVVPSANYEVSQNGTTWYNSTSSPALTLSYGSGTLANTPISVRLKAGLPVGTYNSANDKATISSLGATPQSVALSGTVSAAPTPTIAFGTWTTTALTYPLGTGPSPSRNATVSGSNLSADISITTNDSTKWEVSSDGSAWSASVTYPQSGGTIGTGKKIYVRLKSGLAVGAYSGTLTASSSGATSQNYALSGEVLQPAITVTGTPTLFSYPQGQGPSARQSISVAGSNLAADITVTVPSAYWELSTNMTFDAPSSTIVLPKNASNAVTATTIYIRLKAGLLEGQYNFSTDTDLQATSSNAATQAIDLDGEVTAAKAELNVRGVFSPESISNIIPNGDTTPNTLDNTEFASQFVGDSQTKTYRLLNVGGLALEVSSISLSNTTDFYITASAPYTIAGGSYQDFTITFQPASAGDRTAVVAIASSDLTDPSYTFTILGLGKNPEIGVAGNGIEIPNGNTAISASDYTLIGRANTNPSNTTTVNKSFVISNTGNVPLNISAVNIGGADASQFTVSPTNATIDVNTTGTITVTFAPTSSGIKNAVLSIANDDATDNENPYTFSIQGDAVDYVTCANTLGPLEVLAVQDFETPAGTPTWSYTSSNGTVAGGTAYGSTNATENKFVGANSYQVTETTGTLNFSFNTSGYQDVELSFRLGSFSVTNANGADAADYVRISISTDNVAFSDELSITGSNYNMRWGFGATGSVSSAYNGTLEQFPSNTGNAGISTVTLTNLPQANNLYIRITAKNNDVNEIWAIDNVTLKGKTVAGVTEKTWNGSAWSGDGTPPSASQKAVIDADLTLPYSIGANTYSTLEGCECQVNAGKTLYIGTTDDVNKVSIPADAIIQSKIVNNGTVVLASDSNLRQLDPYAENVFTGSNFVAKRFARLPKMGYTYWSSPVSNQNLYAFSDGGAPSGTPKNRFWQYDEATDMFKNTGAFLLNDSSVFEIGKGYAIRGQNQFGDELPSISHEFAFTGTPHNGNLSFVNLKYTDALHGYNLVGNPYPSNIDFDALYYLNATKIYATAYFWTNNDMTLTQQQGSEYAGNNYAIYNLTGGTPPAEVDPDSPDVGSSTPNSIIKVGQGFIIKSKPGGKDKPLNFTNAVRVTENGTFFNNKSATAKNRFWLQLISPANIYNTILVGYIPGATNDFEIDYDAELFVVGSDSFYSTLGAQKLAIQGRADSFGTDDVVPVGIVYAANGNYTIRLKEAEGIFNNGQTIYLKDKLLNKIVNLSNGSYSFQAVKGTDNTRFEIVYKEDVVLGTNAATKSDFAVYRDGIYFVIKSANTLGKIELYDASGRMVFATSSKDKTARIDASSLANGFYIIKAENSGQVQTRKIIK